MKVVPVLLSPCAQAGDEPTPRTSPSCCKAAVRKSTCADPGAPPVPAKLQSRLSLKEIAPPHGPKSVAGVVRAPAWPRLPTRACHAFEPEALQPSVETCPGLPASRSAPPTNTMSVLAGTARFVH